MKFYFRSIALTLLWLLSSYPSSAQSVAPTEKLRIALDAARFRGPDDSTAEVELYYSFPERSLTYVQDSSGMRGILDVRMIVRRKDSVVAADRWMVPHLLADTAARPNVMNLTGQYRIALGEGTYDLTLVGSDRKDPSRRDSLILRVPVRIIGTSTIGLSDIEFSSSIVQDAQKGPFYKNTFEVIPNASGIFSDAQPCFIYAETYNLLAGADRSDYTLRLAVLDAVNRQVVSRDKIRKRMVDAAVVVDNLGVHRLRSGTYTLLLSILDTTGKALATSAKKFFVYNPKLGIDSTLMNAGGDLPLGVYLGMEEPEIDREFRWLKYEATSVEVNQYAQLKGIDAKRKFLTEFWRRRVPGQRDEYLTRVSYANDHFASMGREGYRTDRGRVYIMYGAPNDIERHPNESDKRPYEIWSYHDIQGGVIFVFVQRNQGSDYELVHSTHRNELHDENWDRPGITQ